MRTGTTCSSWSDVPEWDSIAASREYEVTRDPQALAKAKAAFRFVEDAKPFARGACPQIRYQQAEGGANHLKTLETDGNAIKAALLLYRSTGSRAYLESAVRRYASVRALFRDPRVAHPICNQSRHYDMNKFSIYYPELEFFVL